MSSNKSVKSDQSSSKPKRKISLPWFRQSSFSLHSTLARQHTIDAPGTFRYRLFERSSSSTQVRWKKEVKDGKRV